MKIMLICLKCSTTYALICYVFLLLATRMGLQLLVSSAGKFWKYLCWQDRCCTSFVSIKTRTLFLPRSDPHYIMDLTRLMNMIIGSRACQLCGLEPTKNLPQTFTFVIRAVKTDAKAPVRWQVSIELNSQKQLHST